MVNVSTSEISSGVPVGSRETPQSSTFKVENADGSHVGMLNKLLGRLRKQPPTTSEEPAVVVEGVKEDPNRKWFEWSADKVEAQRADNELRRSGKHEFSWRIREEGGLESWESTFAGWLVKASGDSGEINERLRLFSRSKSPQERAFAQQVSKGLHKRTNHPYAHKDLPDGDVPSAEYSAAFVPYMDTYSQQHLMRQSLYELQTDTDFNGHQEDPQLTEVVKFEGDRVTMRVKRCLENMQAIKGKYKRPMLLPKNMPSDESAQIYSFIETHPEFQV